MFVQVEPGIEGIVYTFELGPGLSVLGACAPGQEMQLYVKSIDTHKKRLELSPQSQLISGLVEESIRPADLRRKSAGARPDELLQALEFLPPEILTSRSSEHDCPGCQRAIQATWKYCVYCGGSLRLHCSACGNVQPDLPGIHYCYECGKSLQ